MWQQSISFEQPYSGCHQNVVLSGLTRCFSVGPDVCGFTFVFLPVRKTLFLNHYFTRWWLDVPPWNFHSDPGFAWSDLGIPSAHQTSNFCKFPTESQWSDTVWILWPESMLNNASLSSSIHPPNLNVCGGSYQKMVSAVWSGALSLTNIDVA